MWNKVLNLVYFHNWATAMNLPNSLTLAASSSYSACRGVGPGENHTPLNGGVITNDVAALIIFWLAAATDLLTATLPSLKQVTQSGPCSTHRDKMLVSAASSLWSRFASFGLARRAAGGS